MLEGMTALGFMAAHSQRARLGLMVGGVHYRHPGLWVKATTTLDVLSGGRAWLGIGAAWNAEESRALAFPFPPLGERFELLEETLQIAHGMFEGERGSEGAFQGRRYRAERLLNSPQSLSRPADPDHGRRRRGAEDAPPGRQYADACNVFGRPEAIARKYAILDAHCAAVGRDPTEIERSTLQDVRLATGRRRGRRARDEVVEVVRRAGRRGRTARHRRPQGGPRAGPPRPVRARRPAAPRGTSDDTPGEYRIMVRLRP